MDGFHKTSVVPILDHIVLVIMNLNFDGITSIINEKNYDLLSFESHVVSIQTISNAFHTYFMNQIYFVLTKIIITLH